MIRLFEYCTCFEQLCAHPQEDNCRRNCASSCYLPELYEDARSEKYKKHEMFVSFFGYFSDSLIYCSNGHFPRLY